MTPDLPGITLAELRALLAARQVTSLDLVRAYVDRYHSIDQSGPTLRSVIEIDPDAEQIAAQLDEELAVNGPRGLLHGIPILLKDNIETADSTMTTAGSLALVGARPARDATVAMKLRAAGAVLLGKANMSEWANFRSTHSSSGWSARGGQCRNPYALDRSPSGSSSGSAVAVAAGLAPISLGTETDGSILSPAHACGVVGIKPTVGLTSRAGVIPIAHSQDTVGPLARTVADAAAVLSVIAGPDPRDPATRSSLGVDISYGQSLDPDALRGSRLGVAREAFFGYSEKADAVIEVAIRQLRERGAFLIDPIDIPSFQELKQSTAEREVLLHEFKADLNTYLGALGPDAPVRSLEDIIRFNRLHAAAEMPFFGQERLEQAQERGGLDEPIYLEALAESRRLSRVEGLDAAFALGIEALIAPTGGPAWKIDAINGDHDLGGSSQLAAMAGYPVITVPAGYSHGLPIGLSFIGKPFTEARLIQLAYAFEQATQIWRSPSYLPLT